MDPTEILEDTFALIGFPGLLLIGLVLLGSLLRRRYPAGRPGSVPEAEAEAARTPAWAWLVGMAGVVAFLSLDAAVGPSWVARGALVLGCVVMAVTGGLLASLWPRRDEILLARRARRGDIAGAIAALEAKVGRDPGPAPPAESADDPWAPPASASRPSASRQALARRLNLLGLLEAKRDDWARALDWYERAERAGGGEIRDLSANKGVALARLGRAAEGIALIRPVFDGLPPGINRPVRAKVTLQLASALIAAGQLDEARTRIAEAEAEADRFLRLHAHLRPLYCAGARTLRDRLAAAEAGQVAPPTPA